MVNHRTAAQDGALLGMKEICAYIGKSENTVIRWIRERGFPAQKVGGEWQSDVGLITEWRRNLVAARTR